MGGSGTNPGVCECECDREMMAGRGGARGQPMPTLAPGGAAERGLPPGLQTVRSGRRAERRLR